MRRKVTQSKVRHKLPSSIKNWGECDSDIWSCEPFLVVIPVVSNLSEFPLKLSFFAARRLVQDPRPTQRSAGFPAFWGPPLAHSHYVTSIGNFGSCRGTGQQVCPRIRVEARTKVLIRSPANLASGPCWLAWLSVLCFMALPYFKPSCIGEVQRSLDMDTIEMVN